MAELYAAPESAAIFDDEEPSEVGLLAQSSSDGCGATSPQKTDGNYGSKHRRCDGDCAHCPEHYGYVDGKWYYGHGHMYDCEFGGNGGMTGRCTSLC